MALTFVPLHSVSLTAPTPSLTSQLGHNVVPRSGATRHFWTSASRLGGLVALLACVPRKSTTARAGRVVTRAATEDEGAETSESDLGLDFSKLRSLLEEQDFKAADAETRSLLIKMAGDAAIKRGWVYFAEVKTIPEKDMDTLETLWQENSNGKFGFVQQRKIWRQVRGQFDKFAEKVSWFTDTWKNRNWPDEFIYNVEAPVGHLPLTNCIRGAQVLEELLSHPAIQNKKAATIKKSKPKAAESSDDEKPGRRSALSMLAEPCRGAPEGRPFRGNAILAKGVAWQGGRF